MAVFYSLGYLLSKQAKSLRQSRDFQMLLQYYRASCQLQKLKITRNVYQALNQANISPETLPGFYRARVLPENAFFPLFLKIKKSYLNKKNSRKQKKIAYIRTKMKLLPDFIQTYFYYWSRLERHHNQNHDHPLWRQMMYPKTKKMADRLSGFSHTDWAELFCRFNNKLKTHYRLIDRMYADKLAALFILRLPIRKHTAQEIKKQYWKLSKEVHPDSGGNCRDFNLLQKAKDVFLCRG